MDRTVELIDIDNPEHAGFIFDLGMTCKDDLMDDFANDIILLLAQWKQAIANGSTKAFLCRVNGAMAGICWLDIDSKGIGYIHAGLMPEFRQGFTALAFLREFVAFSFKHVRKIEMYLPPKNRRAEALVRRIGFKKEGFRKEATVVNGIPEHHVVLAMTRNQYEGRVNERK